MTRDPEEKRRIEREIRARRRASLEGALAGADGGGHLRGASPTPLLRRARLEMAQWLAEHLDDTEGALRQVLLRRLENRPAELTAGLGHPARVVADWLPGLLASPAAMAALVREADMAWGQMYEERPYFERAGEPPHGDDPYTLAGVANTLERLLARARAQA